MFGTEAVKFSSDDTLVDTKGNTTIVNTPKDIAILDEKEKNKESAMPYGMSADDDDDDDDDEEERLVIGGDIKLDVIDVNDLNKPPVKLEPMIALDFEVLS